MLLGSKIWIFGFMGLGFLVYGFRHPWILGLGLGRLIGLNIGSGLGSFGVEGTGQAETP